MYYVDSVHGSDTAGGLTPATAWKSLDRASRAVLIPGCRLVLASGSTFQGALRIGAESKGTAEQPIVIESAGKERATIAAGNSDGIVITGSAYVIVRNLNVVGSGRKAGSDGSGVVLTRTRDVHITDIDVSGFRLNGVSTSGDENTRLTRIAAHDNGSAGINVNGGYGDVPRSRNIYIGYCTADNNPGDPKNLTNHSGNGIVVGGLDGGLIEYCEASNNGWDMPRKGNGPVGIWGWNCDRLTIQHCISHHNQSPGDDGDGFDFDGGVTNSVMQYNLSYSNVGTGYLLCQYPGAARWHNNVVRYNISYNDGSKNFQSGIGLWIDGEDFSSAQVYNNTIVNPLHAVNTLGDVPEIIYSNNVFIGSGSLLVGPFTKSKFQHNLYWSPGSKPLYEDGSTVYKTLEEWAKATGQEAHEGAITGRFADPLLALPHTDAELPTAIAALARMTWFRPNPSSPCISAGIPIADNGGKDLSGRSIPAGHHPTLGAIEP
jgi:hypothetical protein